MSGYQTKESLLLNILIKDALVELNQVRSNIEHYQVTKDIDACRLEIQRAKRVESKINSYKELLVTSESAPKSKLPHVIMYGVQTSTGATQGMESYTSKVYK